MEPIPETLEAIKELTRYGDTDVAVSLLQMSRAVRESCPQCIGLSLAVVADGLTFTMAATDREIALLDSLQYLDGGPCVAAADTGSSLAYSSTSALSEEGWHLFATATAARGVASTLSLPIIRHGRVVAGVNLYGATRDAFDGRHEKLATACGAWAPGAVTNADLPFATRLAAAEAPRRLRDQDVVDQAVGAIAATQGVHVAVALERLEAAAERANITLASAARAILPLLST